MASARPALSLVHPPAIAAVSGSFGRDLETGLRAVERIVRGARARGAGVIVFPEATLGGYQHEELVDGAPRASAPPALRDRETVFARLSAVAGPAVVCIGYTEEPADGAAQAFSSAVCLSGDGVLGHHRKVHIPPAELGVLSPGHGFAAFDTPLGRLGMLICYDKVFPEAGRALALDGAEIVACLAAWPVCRTHPAPRMRDDRQVRHFNALDVARAVENQVVWVAANQFGECGRLRFPGQAKVVDPDGRVLATTGARAGVALARVDPRDAVRRARDELWHLGDRVPPAYGTKGPEPVSTGHPAIGPKDLPLASAAA